LIIMAVSFFATIKVPSGETYIHLRSEPTFADHDNGVLLCPRDAIEVTRKIDRVRARTSQVSELMCLG
jgi:hypothetical protein